MWIREKKRERRKGGFSSIREGGAAFLSVPGLCSEIKNNRGAGACMDQNLDARICEFLIESSSESKTSGCTCLLEIHVPISVGLSALPGGSSRKKLYF